VHELFWWGDLMEGVRSKYLDVDGRIILNGTSTSVIGDRTEKRDSWPSVMKLLVP